MNGTLLSAEADVIIVGYGPSGVAAANLLGAMGISTLALERDGDIYARARAVTINDWTLRCFQSVGLDQELAREMDPTRMMRWRTYAGRELMRVAFAPSTLGQRASHMIYQPAMEKTLRHGVERFSDFVQVRLGQSVTGVVQDSNGVRVDFTDVESGVQGSARARYVLACDGGSSTVRSHLNVPLIGSTLATRWVVVDARVKRWWPERHLLTFWADAKRPVVDIPLALGNHRWEFPLADNESENDFETSEQLWPLLRSMGVTPDEVEIHQHAFYRHHSCRAERWRVGRVLLMGDAAHMMPPWAGQGMQSGIRDAFNLGWKLREVLAGRLPEELLDSFERERQPNVDMLTRSSERLGRVIKLQMTRKERWQTLAGKWMKRLHLPTAPLPQSLPPCMEAGWLHGPIGPGSAVGKMIPQPNVADGRGRQMPLDAVLGLDFVLLGSEVDPATLLSPDQRKNWMALGARFIAVRAPTSAAQSPDDLVDLDGTLIAWLNAHRARAVAVRPDRFVASTDGSGLGVPACA